MIEALENSVVLIKSKKPDNNHFGTAFVVYKSDRFTYLLTCAHVVSDVGGEENVKVDGKDANVILIGTEYDLDIAMLRIKHLLSNSPMLMKSCENTAIQFITAGFYSYGRNTLAEKIEGFFGKEVRLQIKDRAEYDRAWHINVSKDNLLKRGNSGAPVVDKKDGYVVGVLSYREGKGAKGLALSISTLQKLIKLYPTELLDENVISELKQIVIKDDRSLINKMLHESISKSKRFEPNLIYKLISMLKPTPRMVAVIGPEINSALTIDDSILFVRSDLQSGWGVKDIELKFQQPIELSEDLRKVAKINISAALFTHGGHLSKYIDQIAKSFKYVRVSIDAGNSSEHKYYHFLESDLFAEILQNIALLKKLNPEIRLCISYLIAEKNYQSIISLASFLESSLIDFLLVKFSRFSSDNIWINEEIFSEIDSQIELLQNIVSVYYRRPTLSTSTKNIVNKCRTTYLKALVTPDCKLYICNQRRGEKKMSFGSLYEDDFWTIWNSKTHKYVYSQIDTKNCPPCRHVAYNRLFEAVIDNEIPEISQSKKVGELISFL